ncbi:NAD(P)/FAD-dependent oxidoreductase [Cellulomonas wangsupingiae]|uniref:FAD-dependent oxidoreductase n=1 Tax=Cellulomonas wangsupingiae TaxID=2968085 RepID=A0ABY5K643_9CELL|nr:FAD-dependent oxidoreductase [Cellulomonas wangsupingiae]MCC2334009.1 FAD-dependent oxidoreductase [Cellulomonas wangsupingiae]UUI65259.1 FAD-dependent oxidoreductase [Cellulomonas wangsupingiae]
MRGRRTTRPDGRTGARVVVVGGGYAGTMAANRLTGAPEVAHVVLVDEHPYLVERIRLHQLAAGTGTATRDDVVAAGVERRTARAVRVDDGSVLLADGTRVAYDRLVLAVGSGPDVPADVPGARQHALPVAGLQDAHRLADALAGVGPGAAVTVVGGGLSGIEVAAEIAEALPDVRVRLLAGGRLGPGPGPVGPGRRVLDRGLARLGVEVLEGARVAEVEHGKVVLGDGRHLTSDVTVWAAGFAVPDLARVSGLPVDAAGRLRVGPDLVCAADPRVVGAGDAVAVDGSAWRMTCQAAVPMGAHAADVVADGLRGRTPAPFRLAFAAQCVSLGRRRGVLLRVHDDATPSRVLLGGRAAATMKELVCRVTVRVLRTEARHPGRYRWLP